MTTHEQEKSGQQLEAGGNQGKGRLWDSFPKPAGWSARWDGLELDREMQANGEESASQADESTES